jgi:DNA-binding transcriptional LysR family regulator
MQILASVDEAEASLAGTSGMPRGVLRLTVPDAYGRHVLLPVIGKYLKAWPDVQVEVSFTDRVADIVEEGFDLAIRIGVTSADSSFVSRVVARCRAMLCASPDYIAARGEPVDLDDLAAHDCLVFSSRNQRQAWLSRRTGGWIRRRAEPVAARLATLLDAACASLGIAFPGFSGRRGPCSRTFAPDLPEHGSGDVPIIALYPDKRLLEPRQAVHRSDG